MICTEKDIYFFDNRWYWEVKLDNGLIVYQDDGRDSSVQTPAWLRLKEYCFKNNLDIVEYWLKFRDHHIPILIPDIEYNNPIDGLYFAFGIGKEVFCSDILNHHVIAGILIDGRVITETYDVPSLELIDRQHRLYTPELSRFIIWRQDYARKSKQQEQLSV